VPDCRIYYGRKIQRSAAMPMRATPGCVTPGLVLVCHGDLARFAQHSTLGRHAFGDLRHVRDKFGAKLHRIAGASVAGLLARLSAGAACSHCVNAYQQNSGRQRRSACKTCNAKHVCYSPVFRTGELPGGVAQCGGFEVPANQRQSCTRTSNPKTTLES
jgi:hypothetical protein